MSGTWPSNVLVPRRLARSCRMGETTGRRGRSFGKDLPGHPASTRHECETSHFRDTPSWAGVGAEFG